MSDAKTLADALDAAADLIEQQAAKLESLRAERDALKDDAERYRWLRDVPWVGTPLDPVISYQLNAKWDAAIDAARAGGGNG